MKSIKDKIFSIKDDRIKFKKILTICGIKLKFNSYKLRYEFAVQKNKDFLKYFDFLNVNVRENSVLMIEPNDCHGEVLSGIAKYFLDLGYNVDVLISKELFNGGIFERMNDANIRIFETSVQVLNSILKNKSQMQKYKFLYFNSDIVYSQNFLPIEKVFKDIENKNIIRMNHRLECKNDKNSKCRNVVLDKFDIVKEFPMVNAHYFGDIGITNKNDITNFIVVGNIDKKRKNFKLLKDSISYLLKRDVKNFKITVISRSDKLELPKKYFKYIDFKKGLKYNQMYEEMENADFFLTLLDGENPEHERYLTCGTSGSFQLIYGFDKPCLINKKFADKYRFNKDNSIIYDSNQDLGKSMKQAILLNNDDYTKMQENLNTVANDLYNESLHNLKDVLTALSIC